ncbi:hypothetical protein JCM1841_006240 [Sporobolomyces salmonicolor]
MRQSKQAAAPTCPSRLSALILEHGGDLDALNQHDSAIDELGDQHIDFFTGSCGVYQAIQLSAQGTATVKARTLGQCVATLTTGSAAIKAGLHTQLQSWARLTISSHVLDHSHALQWVILVQLGFLTGMRADSFLQGDGKKLFLQAKDVEVVQLDRGSYTLILHIKLFKGNADELTAQHGDTIRIPPINKCQNLHFDPVPTVISLLVHRSEFAPRSATSAWQLLRSMDNFISSSATRFVGIGTKPIFCNLGCGMTKEKAKSVTRWGAEFRELHNLSGFPSKDDNTAVEAAALIEDAEAQVRHLETALHTAASSAGDTLFVNYQQACDDLVKHRKVYQAREHLVRAKVARDAVNTKPRATGALVIGGKVDQVGNIVSVLDSSDALDALDGSGGLGGIVDALRRQVARPEEGDISLLDMSNVMKGDLLTMGKSGSGSSSFAVHHDYGDDAVLGLPSLRSITDEGPSIFNDVSVSRGRTAFGTNNPSGVLLLTDHIALLCNLSTRLGAVHSRDLILSILCHTHVAIYQSLTPTAKLEANLNMAKASFASDILALFTGKGSTGKADLASILGAATAAVMDKVGEGGQQEEDDMEDLEGSTPDWSTRDSRGGISTVDDSLVRNEKGFRGWPFAIKQDLVTKLVHRQILTTVDTTRKKRLELYRMLVEHNKVLCETSKGRK